MTKDKALDLALEALEKSVATCFDRFAHEQVMSRPEHFINQAITAIKQARALDKKAENARELGLDYEPADGTQVSKVWWDGEKLMAKPIPLVDFYQPMQDSTCNETLRAQGKAYPRTCRKCGKGPCIGAPKPPPAQPAPVQSCYCPNCEAMGKELAALKAQLAPVQEPEYWNVIDPAGNIVASETDAIRGWARIAGSYKPTVEGLLGFHDQGWRVLPKITPPAAHPAPVQEPVADVYMAGNMQTNIGTNGRVVYVSTVYSKKPLVKGDKLYTTPPAQPAPAPGYCKHCKQYSIEEPLPAAQRQWVGLNWEDMPDIRAGDHAFLSGAQWAEAKLKEKNGWYRQHVTDGSPCWCEPETSYTDPKTGSSVIVHKEPQ